MKAHKTSRSLTIIADVLVMVVVTVMIKQFLGKMGVDCKGEEWKTMKEEC